MNPPLFIILFLTGVVPITPAVYRRYYLIPQAKTMSDARTYCRTMYTDLATFETSSEANRLKKLAQDQGVTASSWIGLYNDVNSWRWSMGNEALGSWRSWYSPNPDNMMAKETCGAIDPSGWSDCQCTSLFPFICFDDSATGSGNYIYISSIMTWSQAQSYCRQYHTDLASARNQTENSIIQAMVTGETWFGLFRDSWKWLDQTNFTTITWLSGEPSNLLGQENCVFFINGQAGDVLCSRLKPFFCETVITGQKQIIKVKVQSTKDVNEPAVKATVLDKIKEKLSDYVNISVTLREQPNGLVFNKV